MSGTYINRRSPSKCINIILDEVFNKSVPKPTNLRPGYDMDYIGTYKAYRGTVYPGEFGKMIEAEKRYDNLSIINSCETP
jgi:hypothetical protein